MTQPDFRDPRFWIELRQRTSLDGWVGVEECSVWCSEVLVLLREFGRHKFNKIEGGVSTETMGRYGFYVNWHRMLARKYSEGIFIADGTAGQIHQDYPLGYYGYASDAPRRLILFYQSAIRRSRI